MADYIAGFVGVNLRSQRSKLHTHHIYGYICGWVPAQTNHSLHFYTIYAILYLCIYRDTIFDLLTVVTSTPFELGLC